DNASINAVVGSLNNALVTLRTQASKFGSNLSVVQNRQDFTKNMINLLQTGADSLVLADSNEEGANMLALQTRQQLSTTALSLASQADEAVLRLFGCSVSAAYRTRIGWRRRDRHPAANASLTRLGSRSVIARHKDSNHGTQGRAQAARTDPHR